MKDKYPKPDVNDDIAGSHIPGKPQTDEHFGVEAIFDMGDYALSEEQKVALGIHRLNVPNPVEEAEAEKARHQDEPHKT